MTAPGRPRLASASLKTYAILRPAATHYERATCAQVDCERRARGWKMALNLADPEHLTAARWIKRESGRRWVVQAQDGQVVTLAFEAGQDCFETHRRPLQIEPLYVVRGGDARGNPRGERARKLSAVSWRDDFGQHQETLADAAARG